MKKFLTVLSLLLILNLVFMFAATGNVHSARTFTYVINPLHTAIYFAGKVNDSEAEEISSYSITDRSPETVQFYLNFTSNEIGTHSLSVSVEPFTHESISSVRIPYSLSIIDVDAGFIDAVNGNIVFEKETENAQYADFNQDIYIDGTSVVTRHFGFMYDFHDSDLESLYVAGDYNSTITIYYTYNG